MTDGGDRPLPRLTRRRACALLAAMTALPRGARASDTEGTSDWSTGAHARVRLVNAGRSPRNAALRLAGIEVELAPQYLTYWRSPGEAGVPPVASFAGSVNLRDATLLYPAPGRFSEDGAEAIGYENGVVFPVLVTPEDASQPVALVLDLSFATCERLCVPAHAAARLTLGTDEDTAAATLVREAFDRVPVPAAVGEPGPLAITAVVRSPDGAAVIVDATAAGSDVPTLFAEAPDPWFVQAGAGLWSNDGTLRYTVAILSKPPEPAPLPLRLTLAGTDGAIEVASTLDAPPPKP